MKRKTYIIIYGRGGHQQQMYRLLNKGLFQHPREYLVLAYTDSRHPIYEHIDITWTFGEFRDKYSWLKSIILMPFKTLWLIIKTCEALIRYDIRGVVVTGPGIAVVPSILCRMMGKKLVVFETWSKFYNGSLTGRILYRIAGKFIIQNKTLKSAYPKAEYLGHL